MPTQPGLVHRPLPLDPALERGAVGGDALVCADRRRTGLSAGSRRATAGCPGGRPPAPACSESPRVPPRPAVARRDIGHCPGRSPKGSTVCGIRRRGGRARERVDAGLREAEEVVAAHDDRHGIAARVERDLLALRQRLVHERGQAEQVAERRHRAGHAAGQGEQLLRASRSAGCGCRAPRAAGHCRPGGRRAAPRGRAVPPRGRRGPSRRPRSGCRARAPPPRW